MDSQNISFLTNDTDEFLEKTPDTLSEPKQDLAEKNHHEDDVDDGQMTPSWISQSSSAAITNDYYNHDKKTNIAKFPKRNASGSTKRQRFGFDANSLTTPDSSHISSSYYADDDDDDESFTDGATRALPLILCQNYLNCEIFAALFVDQIINQSISVIEEGITFEQHLGKKCLTVPFNKNDRTFLNLYADAILWPSIKDFRVNLGLEHLKYAMSLWEFDENWKYSIKCLKVHDDNSDDNINEYYKYQVMFSIPSKPYPIAQATASVYFTMAISKIKPKQCTVDMFYNYEGNRLVHYSRDCRVQEQHLFNIIDAKLEFFKNLNF